MAPNKVSIGISALFLLGGIAFWIFLPEAMIGQIWVGVAILLIALQVYLKIKVDNAFVNTTGVPPPPEGVDVNQYTASAAVTGDMGKQIMEALEKSGIDPTKGGTYDLTNLPQARDAVLDALKASGIDVAHQVAMAAPAVPIAATNQPVERMTKLEQLKSAGLISDQEFQENRKRILEGL